jgi:hypothetical protein
MPGSQSSEANPEETSEMLVMKSNRSREFEKAQLAPQVGFEPLHRPVLASR